MSRFGGIGIVEDNFVGQLAGQYTSNSNLSWNNQYSIAFSVSYKSSAHFMCFYGMINFYIFTMAYVYSPISTMNGKNKLKQRWQ